MEELLRRQIRTGTAHRAIVGELLDAFEDRDARRGATVAPLLEPLSDREQAILRYLPTTLSNREIAAELFVTTNTVKTHLRSIYRKLDVARRREAVDRARDLRLLSPAAPLTRSMQREPAEAERQRQPVGEQPVGERRQHGVAARSRRRARASRSARPRRTRGRPA